MSIASLTDYSTIFSVTPTVAEEVIITSDLTYATALINSYCDRIFEQATYSEWIHQNYSNDKEIVYVINYPVTKIYYVGIPANCAKIQNTNTSSVISNISYDSNVFTLSWMDNIGNDNTVELLASNNKILSILKTNIEANSGWHCNVESNYVSYPVAFIKSFGTAQVQNDEYDLQIANNEEISGSVDIINENCIKFNSVVNDIFVKYQSGYTTLTMPNDLVWVCCHIANDLWSFANAGAIEANSGQTSVGMKSESIGDYSYTRFDDNTRDQIVSKYSNILNKYVRKNLV